MSIFPTKILLSTDGSSEAGLASRTAAELAESTGSELHVVFVLPTRAPFEYEAMGFAIEGPHEEVKQEGRRRLDEYVSHIEEAGGAVAEAHFRMGQPDDQIVRLAEELGVGMKLIGLERGGWYVSVGSCPLGRTLRHSGRGALSDIRSLGAADGRIRRR